MDNAEILRKAESDEDLTVEEIIVYQRLVKPVTHTYGKYGTLAKIYLEEHAPAKFWGLAGNVPEYLHGIDAQASDMYDTLYAQLSKKEQFKRTGDFMSNLRIETEIQNIIEREILNELVYVK